MSQQKNTLVINGKTYNVKTGSMLNNIPPTSPPVHGTKSLEGFIKTSKTQSVAHQAAPVRPSTRSRATSANALHSKRQHAKTLMRGIVSKPHINKTSAFASRLEPDSQSTITSKNIHTKLATARKHRAQGIAKSIHVKRFNESQSESIVTKKTAPLDVKPSPHPYSVRKYEPVEVEPPNASESSDFFATALSQATSHEQLSPKPTKRRHKAAKKLGLSRRAANISAAALIVIILGGFVAYQNIPNMAMRVAVARAGLHASLPGYQPSGFSLSHNIQTAPGQIVISFKSNSDDRQFKITQIASDWNSQALQDNYVATTDQPYQRVDQNNGKTVFIYGTSNASWVDGGIWYKVEGNSSLTSDQLLKIANSF